ncbi:hypothetical protein GCM10020255_023140 [Rhodococcus baikonurensis]
MYAIRVGTDANVDKVDLTVGRQTAEVGLRVEIGCPAVDVVALAGDENTSLAMWTDSRETADGQLNPLASAIVRVLRPQLTRYYFGPVVIGTSNEHGQIVELSPEHTEILLNALAKASGVPLRPQGLGQSRGGSTRNRPPQCCTRGYSRPGS